MTNIKFKIVKNPWHCNGCTDEIANSETDAIELELMYNYGNPHAFLRWKCVSTVTNEIIADSEQPEYNLVLNIK